MHADGECVTREPRALRQFRQPAEFRCRIGVEFQHHLLALALHRAFRDVEFISNLLVELACENELEDLALTVRIDKALSTT